MKNKTTYVKLEQVMDFEDYLCDDIDCDDCPFCGRIETDQTKLLVYCKLLYWIEHNVPRYVVQTVTHTEESR